jgi:hypothetical protein
VVTRREAAAALRSQRRFLVLISLAIAAYYTLAVHLKGEGEYSGLAVKIGRPDRVPVALWVVFVWALLRYLQRLHEQWRMVRKAVMKEFEYYDHQLVLEAARRSAVRQVKRGQLARDRRNARVVGDVWVTDTVKEMMRERMAERARAQGRPELRKEPDPWFTVSDDGKRIYRGFGVGIACDDQHDPALGQDFLMAPWSRVRTLAHQLHAWARTAIRLPALFEYIAPLLIALLAMVLALVFYVPNSPQAVG